MQRLRTLHPRAIWQGLILAGLTTASSFAAPEPNVLFIAIDDQNDWIGHRGEKAISGKYTLWERSTPVPLIFAGPGVTPGQRCIRPAELLDLYPTLVELVGLTPRTDLEGLSLVPQLKLADAPRPRPAITSHNQGNHAVRSERWRYLRYADGTEELYDHQTDPLEWTNLVSATTLATVIADHRLWLPKTEAPPVPNSAHRVLTCDPATDVANWEGKSVRHTDPIPE